MWYAERDNGEWFVMKEYCEYDEGEGNSNTYCDDVIIDGPMSLNEARAIIDECESTSKSFKKKYGTIYNLSPNPRIYPYVAAGLNMLYFLSPFLIIYIIYNRKLKKQIRHDELKRFKQQLDDGIISQEEYDGVKKIL